MAGVLSRCKTVIATILRVLPGQAGGDVAGVPQRVWCLPSCCLLAACRVELGHELAVGGACGGEVLVAFVELETQVGDLLLERVVVLLERVGAGWGAEPGFPPGVVAEEDGEPAFELLDTGGQPGGSLLGVEQVGLKRGAARGPGSREGRRGCLNRVDPPEQVAVTVEECPVERRRRGRCCWG